MCSRVLDVGAGTGRGGVKLKELKFDNIEALGKLLKKYDHLHSLLSDELPTDM